MTHTENFWCLVVQLIFENNIFKESRKEQKIKTLANIKQDELQFIDATKTSNFCTVQKVVMESWNFCNEHVLWVQRDIEECINYYVLIPILQYRY
ncbi:MAG TPA: hypothetical protein VFI70_03640 [Nitrososphaeraceae archaeon]|nr:hypothetical protein [Nitrososphaeraceae archaeon]